MSATPRKISAFVRWQIIQAFTSTLEGITLGAGYNTQPLVTRDRKRAQGASEHFVLLVEEGSDAQVDGTRTHEIEILVQGAAEPHGKDPVMVRNMLLQDVRTAIMANRDELANQIGTGCHVALGRCDSDMGIFLDDGWTSFEQVFTVRYPQGDTW
jgi:hypothetical protein